MIRENVGAYGTGHSALDVWYQRRVLIHHSNQFRTFFLLALEVQAAPVQSQIFVQRSPHLHRLGNPEPGAYLTHDQGENQGEGQNRKILNTSFHDWVSSILRVPK